MFFGKYSSKIGFAALPAPERLYWGHEVVGKIVEVGANVEGFSLGDRVTLQKLRSCCSVKEIDPPCDFCQKGNYSLCRNLAIGEMPDHLGRGFSDQFLAHHSQLVKIPDSIPDDIAVLIEPAAVSLHSVLKKKPKAGQEVLVIGAGTVGLNVIQFAKALTPDCTIWLLEKVAAKKELARRLGADRLLEGDPYEAAARATGAKLYNGGKGNRYLMGGFDIIYDCVSTSQTIHDSLRWLESQGTYIMVGNQYVPACFDHTPIFYKELSIIGVNAHGQEYFNNERSSTYDLVIKMICEGTVDLSGLVTHRFSLKDYKKAFKLLRSNSDGVIKAVFEFDSVG
jgi:threonine dehydrogenase-like Zn-dependent dehydrogenase